MSDIIGVNVTDCFGIGKLSETISRGIGKIYEPIHLRRMANAHAESIKTLNHAILDADLPTLYGDGTIMINGQDFTELAQRAQHRIAFQELKKQDNLDHIVAHAAKELEEIPTVDSKPVDADWISHFFDAAAHVSSREMQQLWGKILAGEISAGGSYSIRTLECLKTFTQRDAELFSKVAAFFLHIDELSFIPSNEELLKDFGISYKELLDLNFCGILNLQPFQQINLTIPKNDSCLIRHGKNHLMIQNKDSRETHLNYHCYFLTRAADELETLIPASTCPDYLKAIEIDIASSNIGNSNISYRYQISE